MAISKKKKIAAADFNPKKILGLGADVMRLTLGVVGGIATGTTEALSPNGEVFTGLRGSFRFVDPEDNVVLAPVLWLPTGFDDDIKALFAQGENAPSEVQFVYEIATVRAGNPQGYSWTVTPLLNIIANEQDDPVAKLFAEARAETPALADHSAKVPAIEHGEKAKAKA